MSQLDASIPPDGPVQLGPVLLPDGKQIVDWEFAEPVLWSSLDVVPQTGPTWLKLHELHSLTGLVPILLGFLDDEDEDGDEDAGGGEGRPWDSGELEPDADLSEADQLDPAEVIASSWHESLDEEDDDPEQLEFTEPFGLRFPGLAPATEEWLNADAVAAAVDSVKSARIGLIPASRPADVLQLVGFNGAVNRYDSPAPLVTALRSWEDRFGAVLLEVGFAHLRLLVQRPPRTLDQAQAIAAELWAMCDEFWTPDGEGLTTVSEIADCIVGSPFWSLWLD